MKSNFSLLILLLLVSCSKVSLIKPTQLTCEYLKNPSVVDVRSPRLSWINISEKGLRGQKQTAWQVRVASSKADLSEPDLWDSQKVQSDQSTRIEYEGKNLTSGLECWWQVRTWDLNDQVSDWSDPAFWRMGLMDPSDWKAEWIGVPWQGEEALPKPPGGPDAMPTEYPPPAPLLRKTFQINKEVKSAVAFVTGLGYFELYMNGEKVGDDVLVPNQTNYDKRPGLIDQNIPLEDNFRDYKVMYLAYDVRNLLQEGENVVGSILGNGFYNAPKYWAGSYGSPRFLGQIHLVYTDGTEDVIVSDESWKVSKSAIMMDLVYHGEHYDARKEQPGWNDTGFDDIEWEQAVKRKAPYGRLVAHTAYPDKITKRLQPESIEKTDDNKYLVDFGLEISGWLRLNNVEGPEGHKIEIKYLSNQYSGDNSYIFRGDGPESYAARFNWFVFSAVEITNWPGELKPEHLTAEAVNTWIEESAHFETSNQTFNDINKIWKRSQLDNMHGGIASDCPHRERAPYTGDGQVACVTVMHNYDARNFYQKWIQDILGAQNVETGYVPNGAPWQPGCGGGVAWGAAMIIMPWEFYLHYGSIDMLEDNYEGMKEYIRYMQTWVDEDGIMFSQRVGKDGKVLKWFNLGEWVAPGETVPDDMVHTFYFWRCADLTAQTADILNLPEEVAHYRMLASQTKSAFMEKFYNEENSTYGKGGGNIFALKMGVPEEQYEGVINSLKMDIEANDRHIDTGIFGTQFFFEILAENGMQDLAYEVMNQRTEPSYGHWLELGSTTTREQWSTAGSHNHPMFGGGLVWFYRKLAGMRADPDNPGYRHIIFQPQPVDELKFVKYSNNTAYGLAGINWKNEDKKFTMKLTVPVGSEATVYVPALDEQKVYESGREVSKMSEIQFIEKQENFVLYKIGSGIYEFEVAR
jgi:alpha-L-rhamnosidase